MYVCELPILPELNTGVELSSVTVWPMLSKLVQMIISPAEMVIVDGEKAIF